MRKDKEQQQPWNNWEHPTTKFNNFKLNCSRRWERVCVCVRERERERRREGERKRERAYVCSHACLCVFVYLAHVWFKSTAVHHAQRMWLRWSLVHNYRKQWPTLFFFLFFDRSKLQMTFWPKLRKNWQPRCERIEKWKRKDSCNRKLALVRIIL